MDYRIDAAGKILGRLASEVAKMLMGKNLLSFRRDRISDSRVTVYNMRKIKITGKKSVQKLYRRHSGYLGNLKEASYTQLFESSPPRIFRHAVLGMLPKNKLRPRRLKHLIIYDGEPENK